MARKVNLDKLMTVRNYAEQKGMTTQYVYQLIKKGDIPSVKIGGTTLIDLTNGTND